MSASPERPVAGEPGAPPLFLPRVAFPPYRFVPGQAPHPFMDREGWGYGQHPAAPPFVPRERWRESEPYLRGLDFFNRGWWWEAHESWESLWHVVEGRDAAQHELLKGLIQLAACALNRERGHDEGAARLLETAHAALQRAKEAAGGARLCGLDLDAVAADARRALGAPTACVGPLYLRPA